MFPAVVRTFARRRLSAQIVLQVRGEGARGQMAALTIQRTDNFLHTFLQVCASRFSFVPNRKLCFPSESPVFI